MKSFGWILLIVIVSAIILGGCSEKHVYIEVKVTRNLIIHSIFLNNSKLPEETIKGNSFQLILEPNKEYNLLIYGESARVWGEKIRKEVKIIPTEELYQYLEIGLEKEEPKVYIQATPTKRRK